MRVFKFGGASVKTADAVRNVATIIESHKDQALVVVLSAMGKTTNALEKLVDAYMQQNKEEMERIYVAIKNFHIELTTDLFDDSSHVVFNTIEQIFYHLYYYLNDVPGKNYNFEYDRIVSTGEIVSTQIISHYLKQRGIKNQWFSAKEIIITDINYRDAGVDWLKTENAVKSKIQKYLNKNAQNHPVAITQGFVGGTTQGFVTTLGREGSDYSAAILAYTLRANEVTIWKDVAGLLNADPKKFKDPVLLENISYQEAIELSYFGATVIHPKTLKPLLKRGIPLRVRSFFNPLETGSIINNHSALDSSKASYIFKNNQVLLSIFPRDFSFIAEKNLSRIFSEFAQVGIKINLMQNSALSFSVCFDEDKTKTPALFRALQKVFNIKYNVPVELITIRHYDKADLKSLNQSGEIILEQKNRTTLQWVIQPKTSYTQALKS